MTTEPTEKELAKIRKLLNMANQNDSPNEAIIALSQANSLMEKYGLVLDIRSNDVDVLTEKDIEDSFYAGVKSGKIDAIKEVNAYIKKNGAAYGDFYYESTSKKQTRKKHDYDYNHLIGADIAPIVMLLILFAIFFLGMIAIIL